MKIYPQKYISAQRTGNERPYYIRQVVARGTWWWCCIGVASQTKCAYVYARLPNDFVVEWENWKTDKERGPESRRECDMCWRCGRHCVWFSYMCSIHRYTNNQHIQIGMGNGKHKLLCLVKWWNVFGIRVVLCGGTSNSTSSNIMHVYKNNCGMSLGCRVLYAGRQK